MSVFFRQLAFLANRLVASNPGSTCRSRSRPTRDHRAASWSRLLLRTHAQTVHALLILGTILVLGALGTEQRPVMHSLPDGHWVSKAQAGNGWICRSDLPRTARRPAVAGWVAATGVALTPSPQSPALRHCWHLRATQNSCLAILVVSQADIRFTPAVATSKRAQKIQAAMWFSFFHSLPCQVSRRFRSLSTAISSPGHRVAAIPA